MTHFFLMELWFNEENKIYEEINHTQTYIEAKTAKEACEKFMKQNLEPQDVLEDYQTILLVEYDEESYRKIFKCSVEIYIKSEEIKGTKFNKIPK